MRKIKVKNGYKVCSKCGINKPINSYYKDNRAKSGFASACKICKKRYEKSQHAKTLDYQRHLKYRYGIGIKQYNRLFQQQKGRCAICGKHQSDLHRQLDVDHDHITGKVRGLLCNYCNRIVEQILDSGFYRNNKFASKINSYLRISECYVK